MKLPISWTHLTRLRKQIKNRITLKFPSKIVHNNGLDLEANKCLVVSLKMKVSGVAESCIFFKILDKMVYRGKYTPTNERTSS